jgi:hypothetical protein
LSGAGSGSQGAASNPAQGIAGGSSPGDPNDPRDNRQNWQRVNDKYLNRALQEQGTNAHQLKQDYLGRNAQISRFDIYVDKVTGQLAIFEKRTRTLVETTHIFIP